MRSQVVNASFLSHLRTSLEDGEIGSPRVGSPRMVSQMVASPRIGSPRMVSHGYFSEQTVPRRYASSVMGANAKQRAEVVGWLNGMFHSLRIPPDASEEDLRRRLVDGLVLCGILKKLKPGFVLEENVNMEPESPRSLDSPRFGVLSAKRRSENVKKFLLALDELGSPKFDPLDLEQGPITAVVECLLSLKNCFSSDSDDQLQKLPSSEVERSSVGGCDHGDQANEQSLLPSEEERPKNYSDSRFPNILEGSVMLEPSEPSPPWLHFVGQKFNEVFQLNEGCYSEALAMASSGMVNLNSLDQMRILLGQVMQEIERRLSTQGEHVNKLKLALKEVLSREEKLVSRAGVLKTLATGTSEEIKIVTDQLQKSQAEKNDMEEKRKLDGQHALRLMKEKEEIKVAISSLNQELEATKRTYEQHCLNLETQSKEAVHELEWKMKQLECFLEESKRKSEELEAVSESRDQNWKLKELGYQRFIGIQLQVLGDLKKASQAARDEVLDVQRAWSEEINNLSVNIKGLADASQKYHIVLDENRRLYNEVQDLKGNIRIYCRVRPFLTGEAGNQSIIEYIGDDGELLVSNPSKPGKNGQHMFKFNKVFGPTATQEEVFMDIQPLIQSVLDGFNVCIFAYGQTGSGKSFTMAGPDSHSEATWGVNYRALNDLFLISQKRSTTYAYEVGVQMVEIYNEQVHDLLTGSDPQKQLGIWSTPQHNGLRVPDASLHHVNSTADVLALMKIGQFNRAVGATAMNEKSSRSHSILTVHIRGTDLETGLALRGSLHLVDLAGSERVDRSETTGDMLREAQHINKSLSALGDVIYALAQKSTHIPYRNSKLTQILQGSLGGQAKTLMFVQLNPDIGSYFESISTLRFAERVSVVELGAAKSYTESKEIKDLLEQVAQLKELVARKDAEIDRLWLLKDCRPRSPEVTIEKQSISLTKYASSLPPKRPLQRGPVKKINKLFSSSSPRDAATGCRKTVSDFGNYSEYRHSEFSSEQSFHDFRHQKKYYRQPKLGVSPSQNAQATDVELLGLGEGDSKERLAGMSDAGLCMGTETDGSISAIVELSLLPDAAKDLNNAEKRPQARSRIPHPPPALAVPFWPQSGTEDSLKPSIALGRPIVMQPSTLTMRSPRRWQ